MTSFTKKIKVLSIYRSQLNSNRGTANRVRSILYNLARYKDIDLTLCSWDRDCPIKANHIYLSNNHLEDFKKIYNFVKNNRVDIVMGHVTTCFYYLLPLKFLTGAKIVLEMHGFKEEEAFSANGIGRVRYERDKLLHTILYRMCDLITTCSDTATEILSKYNKNVVTIFGGVDLALFNPQAQSGGLIKKDKNKIIIGYAGSVRMWQGLDFLIMAYYKLLKEYPEFKLSILTSGDGHVFQGHGIESIGPLEYNKVPSFLIDCDILVVPRTESKVNKISFPSKLPEYMAMGKPVVVSCTSDADKIVEHGVNGLLYNPGDIEGFKENILRLRDPDLRMRLGYNAFQTVRDNFTWERQTNILVNNIRAIVHTLG